MSSASQNLTNALEALLQTYWTPTEYQIYYDEAYCLNQNVWEAPCSPDHPLLCPPPPPPPTAATPACRPLAAFRCAAGLLSAPGRRSR